ncbi:putative sulfate permease C3H7.02 [Leucoagaricus sp. SymC.cos]|nr:putative sulfate permease C3H7.02 [Leucoagaricus sp. SymC.cos]
MVPSTVKRATKKIINHSEHDVEAISIKDTLSQLWTNPVPRIPYFIDLFPILQWIHRYNIGWLSGNVIVGLTVGMVAVPLGMSYAQIAILPPEYGLYSSFVGVFIYCFFATSKDISIGPVAVMSLIVANMITLIALGIGILRLGWLVEFISEPVVSGFVTGSAITIGVGQLAGLMGMTGFNTRATPYEVAINVLKHLPHTTLDAAFGVTGFVSLYLIRSGSVWASRIWPRRVRIFFFLGVLRNATVVLILTVAAWLYCRKRRDENGHYPIRLLQTVPAGLKHVRAPNLDSKLVSTLMGDLPIATIILLLEHIAIAKASFERSNGYNIDPNQEPFANGLAKCVGSCFGAYPATGSFASSALNCKSGVRTPMGGVVTSIVVIVSLYGLTEAFFWIPQAGLSAIIIHAVADLVASPHEVYLFWRISPFEFFIWFTAVILTVFVNIETGIYLATAASLILLLVRLAHSRGSFLGRVSLGSESGSQSESREIFLPLNTKIMLLAPGVIAYKFEEGYLYPNCSIVNSALVDYVKENMRRGKDLSTVSLHDRPWNDSGPRNNSASAQAMNERKPWLHAIVLDFSSVSQLDTTATQELIDTRTEVERWTDFHFATIQSPWIRRALIAGGFGFRKSYSKAPCEFAAIGSCRDSDAELHPETSSQSTTDIETGDTKKQEREEEAGVAVMKWKPLLSQDTPFFHVDLVAAIRAAESGLHKVCNFDFRSEAEELQ